MKILKYIGIAVLAIATLFIIVCAILPSDFKVERSLEMNAPAGAVYAAISDYNNWARWSPWMEKDKSIVNTFEGTAASVGHKMSWTSDESGNGSMTITQIVPNETVAMDLELKDMGMISLAKFVIAPTASGVKLTWSDEGNLGFFYRMFGIMSDKMMGPDFERGLVNIKTYCEGMPKNP